MPIRVTHLIWYSEKKKDFEKFDLILNLENWLITIENTQLFAAPKKDSQGIKISFEVVRPKIKNQLNFNLYNSTTSIILFNSYHLQFYRQHRQNVKMFKLSTFVYTG